MSLSPSMCFLLNLPAAGPRNRRPRGNCIRGGIADLGESQTWGESETLGNRSFGGNRSPGEIAVLEIQSLSHAIKQLV